MASMAISESEARAAKAFIEYAADDIELRTSAVAKRGKENIRRRSADELDEWLAKVREVVHGA